MSERWHEIVDYLGAARHRRTLRALRPTKRVAVVVPLSLRPGFTDDEEVSLRHLERFLGSYDRYFVAPPGLAVTRPGFGVKRFPSRYFGSSLAHRKLLLSPGFYPTFRDYQYILLYHLDALALSDQMLAWCAKGYDFIGAPWVAHPDAPYAGQSAYENKVGCGGFSLRRVEGFLRLLVSRVPAIDAGDYEAARPFLFLLRRLLIRSPLFNNVRWELARLPYLSEERFLANRAAHFDPDFRIAPMEEALRFAFECVPRHCYELTGRTLPFGCHAWQRYDREFWEPHVLSA